MSRNRIPAPVPPANQRTAGPQPSDAIEPEVPVIQTAGFQEQDPKRRLGDFVGTGEHSRQQPGPLNDGKARKKGKGGTR